mgnify:CR=1 FL=1
MERRRMIGVPDADMTIDELARASGMTVRNIRAHQSRGLLPAPEVRARTGYYGPEHVARLQLCLLYTSPSPRDRTRTRMPSSAC